MALVRYLVHLLLSCLVLASLAPTSCGAAGGVRQQGGRSSESELEGGEEAGASDARVGDGRGGETWKTLRDVTPTGKCAEEVEAACKDVVPGEQQLLQCIEDRVQLEDAGKVPEGVRRVSDECKREVREFNIQMYQDISMNTRLSAACKVELGASNVCDAQLLYSEPGNVLACLRERRRWSFRRWISKGCGEEVLRAEMAAASDMRMDPALDALCSPEADKFCQGVEPGGGRIQECLRSKMSALAWNCQAALIFQEIENADDIRLNPPLFSACLDDTKKFCADVMPGEAKVQDCLEAHREAPEFTKECNAAMTRMMERRAMYFLLDPSLRKHCRRDIAEVCSFYDRSRTMWSNVLEVMEVMECLQEKRGDIKDSQCRHQVQQATRRAAQNIRFDPALADACREELISFCEDVPGEHSQAFSCLQEHRHGLNKTCADMLFKREVWYARDTWKTLRDITPTGSCAEAAEAACKDVVPGEQQLLQCIEDRVQLEDAGKAPKGARRVSGECKREVRAFKIQLYHDISMNTRLSAACKGELANVCDAQLLYPEPGNVLRCLRVQRSLGNVSKGCSEEVLRAQMAAASDIRMDPYLDAACSPEADKFCQGVEPGRGRIQECLRSKGSGVALPCQAGLMSQEMWNADDIRLNAPLFSACLDDTKKFCADVMPGDSRVKDCLESHREAPEFTKECNAEMTRMMERRARDFCLDPSLRRHCNQDITEVCGPDVLGRIVCNDLKVMECLQESRGDIRDPQCRHRVQQHTRRAADNIWFDPALADACKEDLISFCKDVPGEHSQAFTCLQEHRVGLNETCTDALFKREVWYASDVTFKAGMRRDCQEETSKLCGSIRLEQGDVIRCLQEHEGDVGMGEACRREVRKDRQHRATEFPANYRLNKHCFDEAHQLCGHECDELMSRERCGGAMLKCLSTHFRQLNSSACQQEVVYFQQREQATLTLQNQHQVTGGFSLRKTN